MRVSSLSSALLLVFLPVLAPGEEPTASAPGSLMLDPPEIEVGALHDGARLQVEATVPAGYEVAVVCAGADSEVELTKKGRAMGVLWMNTGSAKLEHVPALYQVNTVHSLDEIASPEVRRSLDIGYDALELRVTSDQEEAEGRRVFRELVKLKERERLYAEREHGVQVSDLGDGLARLSTTFFIPARTPFGSYRVAVVGFRAGAGSQLASAAFGVHPVGLVAFMSSLARERGLLFGLLAVGVAIAMGLVTGVVFGRGSKKVH